MWVWVIYAHPDDFPAHYVVRRWTVTPQGEEPGEYLLVNDLEEARSCVPAGCVRMGREETDAPCVVETWV